MKPSSFETPARSYAPGMGEAVADRTVNRMIDGRRETWEEVAHRVAVGNTSLAVTGYEDFDSLHHHLRQASVLLSGRHLQHGDAQQSTRNQEVFTNCSTAATSFILFYLLLNGSGVGRAYDDAMMAVNWAKMPTVVCTIDPNHADVLTGEIANHVSLSEATFVYPGVKEVFHVPDSREGWAQAIELIELRAWERKEDLVLILDFSHVRPKGSPIGGMQDRPASGPGPLIDAIDQLAQMKGQHQLPVFEQTMEVDHALAACVAVGGARRAARMATKDWRDHTVLRFIEIKKGGRLWSSNNSVTVDAEFWAGVRRVRDILANSDVDWNADGLFQAGQITARELHAFKVFNAVAYHSYYDRTGEPGLINQDKLTANDEGMEIYDDGIFAGSAKFQPSEQTVPMLRELLAKFKQCDYQMITNPCGEITLSKIGGYCVIGDVVPFHAQSLADAEEAFRVTARALIRVNAMDCLYRKEVNRTNRIGVGITGLHEFAWKFFGYGWKDLVDEEKSKDFWMTMARFKRAVTEEARYYSRKLGFKTPHTDTTIKPAGTTSKLFGLSEGAHLPAMREFLRWVQFINGDPLITEYQAKGYPTRELTTYKSTTIVGFPTQPAICTLGMGDKLVTAAEATPEEQYQWLRLLEKYWIKGVYQNGEPLPESGNQVSYTLKYDPAVVSYTEFYRTLIDGQSSIRCCSVMPQIDATAFEYQPEQPIDPTEFMRLTSMIEAAKEGVGFEHVSCAGGSCPISWEENGK